MSPYGLLLLLVQLCLLTKRSSAARIGLFPSSGAYSHDMAMRAAGEVFRGHDVAWVQTYIFDLGRQAPTLPSHWQQMIVDQVSDESIAALDYTKLIIWETVAPIDVNRLLDYRAPWATFNVLKAQHYACLATLRSNNFIAFVEQHRNLDMVVVDYILQECHVSTSALFNATVSVFFSNWPLADVYVSSLNLPTNPASVATTCTGLPTQMNYAQRISNTVVYCLITISQWIQVAVVDGLHAHAGYESDLLAIKSRQLLYGTHSELMVEMIRPISNQIKYFGCERCRPTNLAKVMLESNERHRLPFHPSPSEDDIRGVDRQLLLTPFVVVTFGSLTSFQVMGAHMLMDFMRAFGALNYTVLWQFDGQPPVHQHVPANVQLFSWLPLKELFEHPNMHLLVCHGGITTLNEAIHRAVPILGVPLQGDQPTNLRRLYELGVSEIVSTYDLSAATLSAGLNKMLVNLHTYETRAIKLARMIRDHQDLEGDRQQFWLQWALRVGPAARSRNYFSNGYRKAVTYYHMPELICLLAIVTFAWLLVAGDEADKAADRWQLSSLFPKLSLHFDDDSTLAIDEAPHMYR